MSQAERDAFLAGVHVGVLTVEGPAAIEPAGLAERAAMARRYLGTEEGDAWTAADTGTGYVMLRMTPEHWLSADFSKDAG